MPDSLTPVIREEEFLSAIAGESTMPTPVIRREEFLAEIGNRVDGLANDVEDLADIVPTPEAEDSGKVLTAGADGTASWQTPSGGGATIIEMEWQAPDYSLAILDILPETLYAGYISGAKYLVHELQDEGTANEADAYYTIYDLFRKDQEGDYYLSVTVAHGTEEPLSFETSSKLNKPSTGGLS